jgi:S1-C subfamily serine protease
MRYGARKTFRVKLTSAPSNLGIVAEAEAPAERAPAPSNSRLGISVEPPPVEFVQAVQLPEQYRGLRVAQIDPGSPSENRLFVNDIIVEVLPEKTKIRTMEDLTKALQGVRGGDYVSFLVYRPVRGGGGRTAVVNLRTATGR